MRAGAFSEKRVIDLLNRRFISFYFNRSGLGEGDDKAARAFTTGKTKNPYAYFACFKADGTYLGETPLYGDKDQVFDFLMRMLAEHPEYGKPTTGEKEVLARSDAKGESPAARLASARLLEELGRYDEATKLYAAVPGKESTRALLRIARYQKDWKRHAEILVSAKQGLGKSDQLALAADFACEKGYALLAKGDHKAARELLQKATKTHLTSPRLAELHFSAGRACWFLDDRDWAKLHWCWVVENLPDSSLQRRCYIAAAAEAMPYVNPELDGYKAPVGNIGTMHITRGYERARRVYRRLLPAFQGN